MNPPEDIRLGLPSASGAERFVACPGSFAAEKQMPPLPTQDYTQQGTSIHEAVETGDTSELTESEADIASRLKALEATVVEDWLNTLPEDERQHIVRVAEKRLWIRDANLNLVASAQLDVFHVGLTQGLLIDFKTGYLRTTSASQNWQLLVQALSLLEEYPQLISIRVCIAASRFGSSLDVSEYTAQDLLQAKSELLHAVWRSKQVNAPRTPGSWCQYCRAKSVCPQAAELSTLVLHEIPHRDKLQIVEAVQKLTPPQLAEVFKRSKVAKQIFEAIESRLKAMPETELNEIGVGFKKGAKKVNIVDEPTVWSKLADVMNEEERVDCTVLSFPLMRKVYAKRMGIKEPAAEIALSELLGNAIEITQNKPSLEVL
jgi:hypothetical protein